MLMIKYIRTMKILLLTLFLFMPVIGEESSTLDKFEENLTKKRSNSSESSNNSSSNHYYSPCNTHSHYNYNCDRCYRHRHQRQSFSEKMDNFRLGMKLFGGVIKGAYYLISSPIWLVEDIVDDYEDSILSFDKYPFHSSGGMYKTGEGKSEFFNTEISSFSFDDAVYGDKIKIKFQSEKNGFSYSHINLKENFNSEIIKKNMNHLMCSRMFAINNNFFNKHVIDFSYGFGLSNWKSESYEDSGLRVEYSINTFLKPFSLKLNLGYSNIGNGIYDLATGISYHYKRLSLALGYQKFKTYQSTIIQGRTLSIGFWF